MKTFNNWRRTNPLMIVWIPLLIVSGIALYGRLGTSTLDNMWFVILPGFASGFGVMTFVFFVKHGSPVVAWIGGFATFSSKIFRLNNTMCLIKLGGWYNDNLGTGLHGEGGQGTLIFPTKMVKSFSPCVILYGHADEIEPDMLSADDLGVLQKNRCNQPWLLISHPSHVADLWEVQDMKTELLKTKQTVNIIEAQVESRTKNMRDLASVSTEMKGMEKRMSVLERLLRKNEPNKTNG